MLDPSPRNDAILDQLLWQVPALANTSTCGFRPGLLAEFAGDVLVDEQSYYFARRIVNCCVFEILLGGVLQKSVDEDFSFEEMEDLLVTVEASPAFLGR